MIDPTLLKPILTRTRELVARGWCQDYYAQDAEGRGIYVLDPLAQRWSLEGALSLSIAECHQPALFPKMIGYLSRFLPPLPPGFTDPEEWQDFPTTTQADVLALLDRAIGEVGQ